MIAIPAAFPRSYATARAQFLAATFAAGLVPDQRMHPLRGREGEPLAMDVVYEGPPGAQHLLIVSSGCHGVEGFCGSGVQVFALHDAEWREKARAQGVGVLYLHALNPHGFSYLRRVTHEGVDLNRNFVDFSQPLPANPGYAELNAVVLPAAWPPTADNEAALLALAARDGEAAVQHTISRGQYAYPAGLYYGGTAPTWSHTTLRAVLQQYASNTTRLGWIDLHTGLGPNGHGERIFSGLPGETASIARARQWWGGDGGSGGSGGGGATPLTLTFDGSSSSGVLQGEMWRLPRAVCPQAEITGIALEFGTQPGRQVLDALRGDHWLQQHPLAPAALAATIHQQMRDAFYTDTDAWRAQIISQARQALFQAVDGLSAPA